MAIKDHFDSDKLASYAKRALPYAVYTCLLFVGEWSLLMSISYHYGAGWVTKWTFIAAVCLLAAVALFIKLLIKNKAIDEKLYLLCAIPLLFGYSFFMMPFADPDGIAHIARLFDNRSIATSLTVPAQLYTDGNGWIYHYSQLPDLLSFNYDYSQTKEITRIADKYSELSYLLPSLFTVLGTKLGINAYLLIYNARLINGFIFLFVSYWIIKRLPAGKIFALVFLMNPILFQQCASYSADSLSNTAALGMIGQILFMRFDDRKKLPQKEWIILFVLMFLNIVCKFVYAPMALAALILYPKIQSKIIKRAIPIAIIILIIGFPFFLIHQGYGLGFSNLLDNFRIDYFFASVFQTAINYGDILFWQFCGGNLGWPVIHRESSMTTIRVPICWIFFLAMLILSYLASHKKEYLHPWERTFLVCLGLLEFLLVLAALYYGSAGIVVASSLQGRYYLAPGFMMILALLLKRSTVCQKIPSLVFAIITLLVNLASLCAVIVFFW